VSTVKSLQRFKMENQKRSSIMMFLISMRAVLWGFLGVRKRSGQDADMASVTFVHIVLAGILSAVIFMTILLFIVKAVVSN
jgi:small-conductance mechanosensitive channel